ncbi:MAG: hypothetical protein RRY55_06420 [Bacteroidales bacterium]
MNSIEYIIISFYKIYVNILFRRRPDVIFYYPQHFNRSEKGTNPYFDPILNICNENNIQYMLLEEPDDKTSQPRNSKAIPADFLFWTILVVRKIICSLFCYDYIKQERITARVINIFTLGRLRSKRYVTISGSMEHLFAAINKSGRVYDLQHGIIYSTHWGYFDTAGNILKIHYAENINFMVFGQGFYNTFFINDNNNKILKDRVLITGYPLSCSENISARGDSLLYSLQFTDDNTNEKTEEYAKLFGSSLSEIPNCSYNILYKHHPRFNNVSDLSYITEKYENIFETSENISKLKDKIKLHITFNSTASFEYASYGIPTYFLFSDILPLGKTIFYDEYQYPLYKDMSINEVLDRLNDPISANEDAKIVKEWYERFYSPFDKDEFLKIMKS